MTTFYIPISIIVSAFAFDFVPFLFIGWILFEVAVQPSVEAPAIHTSDHRFKKASDKDGFSFDVPVTTGAGVGAQNIPILVNLASDSKNSHFWAGDHPLHELSG